MSQKDTANTDRDNGDLERLKEMLILMPKEFDPEVNLKRFKVFVDDLCKHSTVTKTTFTSTSNSTMTTDAAKDYMLKIPADPWSCCQCHGVIKDPVTLPCGHSCCKNCIIKELGQLHPACAKCKVRLKVSSAPFIRVNVLVNQLCKKFWTDQLKALELRNEGNEFFKEGKFEDAIEIYNQSIELNPGDHLCLGNRSHAFLKTGQTDKALTDSEMAIKSKPDWAKGYFRKAMALQQRGLHKESFIALYQCLILEEENVKPIKSELVKILQKIVESSKARNPTSKNSKIPAKKVSKCYNSDHSCDSKAETSKEESAGFLDNIVSVPEDMNKLALKHPTPRPLQKGAKISKEDFDCPLCLRILYKPVTTPCGHTFCKMCLDRILDHNPQCPMCKSQLYQYLAERREAIDEFMNETILKYLPEEHQERESLHLKDLEEMVGGGADSQGNEIEIPVFVCTMTFPSIPCPLHVFEPRYRLMVRRVMEAGTREFGMCCKVDNYSPFSDYGTMLEIRDIQYFPDGRAVMDTVGGRRFKVLSRSMRDGYHVAKVEFIKDSKIMTDNHTALNELKIFHDKILSDAKSWFQSMNPPIREGILKHYGQIPEVENDYWTLPNGPSWIWWFVTVLPLDPHGQLQILAQPDLQKRLEGIQRILRYLARFNPI